MVDEVKNNTKAKWKKAARLSIVLFASVMLILASGLIYLNTDSGRGQLARNLSTALSNPTSKVVIDEINGSLFSMLEIPSITVEDERGKWLELQDIIIDWSPSALFNNNFHANHISADRLLIYRGPESTREDPNEGKSQFTLPTLPIDIDIENFNISTILTGAELVEATPDFSLSGNIKLTNNDGIETRLDLKGSDQHSDSINLDISFPPDGSNLETRFDLFAPKGGLLASVSEIPLDDDLNIMLSGNGPISKWDGEAQITIGSAEFSNWLISTSEYGLLLNSETHLSGFIQDKMLAIAGSTLKAEISLGNADNDDKRMIKGTVSNDIAVIKINSSITLNDTPEFGETSMLLSLQNTDPVNELMAPVYVEAFEVKGTLSNLPDNPRFNININGLNTGISDQISLTLDGGINVLMLDQNINISTSGNISNMDGSALEVTGDVFKSSVHWNMEAIYEKSQNLVQANRISISHDEFDITGTAQYGNEDGTIVIDLESAHPSLASTFEKLGIDIIAKGALKVDLHAIQENESAPLKANLNVNTSEIDLGNEILNLMLGSQPKLNAVLEQGSDGQVDFSEISLNGNLISFSSAGHLTPQQEFENTSFNINLQNLEKLNDVGGPTIEGDIIVTGEVSNAAASPSLNFSTGFKALDIQGLQLTNFKTEANLTDIANNLNGKITAQSDSNYGPLDLKILMTKNETITDLGSITARMGNYNLSGNLQIPDGRLIDGTLLIKTANDNNVPSNLAGDITLDLSFAEKENNQLITINGEIRELQFSPDPETSITLETADINGEILLDQDNSPEITLSADITNLYHPQISSRSTIINISPQDQGIGFTMTSLGIDSQPYQIEISGDVLPAENNTQLIKAIMNGSISDTPIAFSHMDKIQIAENTVRIPDFVLTLGDGQITGTAETIDGQIVANFDADNADFRSFMAIITELPLSGILNGNGTLQGNQEILSSQFELSLSDIVFNNKTGIAADDISISLAGNIDQNKINATGKLLYPGEINTDFNATIPLMRSTNGDSITISKIDPLTGSIRWNGEVKSIWPALNLINHDLSGILDGALNVSGTIEQPRLNGNLGLTGGRYENMQTGFVADDINMLASIENRIFTLDNFSANDGEDGSISATATVTLKQDYSFDAQTEINLENAKLVRQPELAIEATSDLIFIKNNDQTRLSGEIVVNRADIGAIEQGGPTITTLDVTEINGEGIVTDNRKQGNTIGPVDLDLILQVPGQLFVRSFGLDSEWKANLTVNGTSEVPIINGTAEQIRGYFEFSGKRFDITRGNFTFPGDQSNDPVIEIMAQHQLTDMVANLRIYGRASNPQLEMSSTPYLPENEVMARILFGTSVADLTAIEAVQLASAIHSLSNGGGPGLMGGIRRAIGVDRFSIDNDASREYGTTITGGKYLADNVYVEVSTAPATGQTATSVEVGLTRNLSLVTRRTLDHDNNLSIRWSWDY